MSNPQNSFQKQCETVAHQFVQTMVFMDDRAGYESPIHPKVETVTPAKGIMGRSGKQHVESRSDPELEENTEETHALNVADLLESAMKKGLVCSIHKPQSEEDYKLENLQAVLNADIVCFDWIMKDGDDGEITTKLIKGIISEDSKVGGKHRLLAIYTFKPDLKSILGRVQNELIGVGTKSNLDAKNMTLTGEHFRIVGLRKVGGTQLKDYQVKESDLPDRLIGEFSNFNRGLMPNFTMAAIAVLRDSTSHILAKLSAKLDGPFLTHKSLLPTPEDATNYASELVASELKSMVYKHRISDELLSDELIKSFLDNQEVLKLKYAVGDTKKVETEISQDLLFKIITEGLGKLEGSTITELGLQLEDDGTPTETQARTLIANALSSFLTEDYETAHANNLEFLKVTSLAADLSSRVYIEEKNGGSGKIPMLQLGTIVKENKGGYLVCLQPSCDSIRVADKGQPFWFLQLHNDDIAPLFVVQDEEKSVRLSYKPNIKNSRFITFNPTNQTDKSVEAKRSNSKFLFESKAKKGIPAGKYHWIAELKLDVARKIGQELAEQYSRIGLDEFELSRIKWKYP